MIDLQNPFCSERKCTRYAYQTIGGRPYCRMHTREIVNEAIAAVHDDNDATIEGEIAEVIQERLEERVGL